MSLQRLWARATALASRVMGEASNLTSSSVTSPMAVFVRNQESSLTKRKAGGEGKE